MALIRDGDRLRRQAEVGVDDDGVPALERILVELFDRVDGAGAAALVGGDLPEAVAFLDGVPGFGGGGGGVGVRLCLGRWNFSRRRGRRSGLTGGRRRDAARAGDDVGAADDDL